jgi:hypothetical protein
MSAVDHMADPQRPIASTFTIREAREDDWPQIWPIIHDVITEQQTSARVCTGGITVVASSCSMIDMTTPIHRRTTVTGLISEYHRAA